MLQSIRELTQGWIAGIIISVIILSFALWGIHSYFESGINNHVVATVNGVEITKEQLNFSYERLRNQAQAKSTTPLSAADDAAIKERALRSLVEMQALKQASRQQGFRVSEDQVEGFLQSMPEFQTDGKFSVKKFNRVLESAMLTPKQFLDLIQEDLILSQPKTGIMLTEFSLPNEVKQAINLVNEQREIKYFIIPTPMLNPISANKIQEYYAANKKLFMTKEEVQIEYVILSMKDLLPQNTTETVNEDTLRNIYKENTNSYMQPKQFQFELIELPVTDEVKKDKVIQAANKAHALLMQNKSSADVAKEISGHVTIQSSWLSLNQIPVELQKAFGELTKEGEVSTPVETEKGLVVIKLTKLKPAMLESFENVREKVRSNYFTKKAEEKFTNLKEKLADLAYEQPDSLQNVANTLKLPIMVSGFFSRDISDQDVSDDRVLKYKKVRDIAFTPDVLNDRNNSDVIPLDNETVVVIRVKDHKQPALLSFNDVSKRIEEILKSQELNEKSKNTAFAYVEKLQNNSMDANASIKWENVGVIERFSNKINPAIVNFAFKLAHPIENKPVFGYIKFDNQYAVVALLKVLPGVEKNAAQAESFNEQMQVGNGLFDYELYTQSQIKSANININ